MNASDKRWKEAGSHRTGEISQLAGLTEALTHSQPTTSLHSEEDWGPARWWHSQEVSEAPGFWLHAGELGWVDCGRLSPDTIRQ